MIKLFGFGRNLGLIDASPFVVKVHAFLKVAKLPYKTVSGAQNLGKSPKGKLPFIVDGEKTIGDSQLIIEYLSNKYTIDLDEHLDQQQKACSYLITKSLDENLYWCLVWSRWQHEATWQEVKNSFFKGIPFPLSKIVPKIVRKKTLKALQAQGIGRHQEAEIISIADQTFSALSVLLGDQKYFHGETISLLDISAYAFLSSLIDSKLNNELCVKARSYPNLIDYCQRFQKKYFPV